MTSVARKRHNSTLVCQAAGWVSWVSKQVKALFFWLCPVLPGQLQVDREHTSVMSELPFVKILLFSKVACRRLSITGLESCTWLHCCRTHWGIFSPDTRGAGAHQKQNCRSCLPGHEASGLRWRPAAFSIKGRLVNVLSLFGEVPTLSAEGGGSRRQWRMMWTQARLSAHDPFYRNRQ